MLFVLYEVQSDNNDFVEENRMLELIGSRPNRVNKIQNGRHVNKAEMHSIAISLHGPALLWETWFSKLKVEFKNSRFIIQRLIKARKRFLL